MTDTTMQQSKPIIRTRINIESTVKDGFRLGEVTVEWTGQGIPDWHTINDVLRSASDVGRERADALNTENDR